MCHIICAAWKYVSSIWDKQGLFMFYTLIRTKPFFIIYIFYIYKIVPQLPNWRVLSYLTKMFPLQNPLLGWIRVLTLSLLWILLCGKCFSLKICPLFGPGKCFTLFIPVLFSSSPCFFPFLLQYVLGSCSTFVFSSCFLDAPVFWLCSHSLFQFSFILLGPQHGQLALMFLAIFSRCPFICFIYLWV